MNSKDETEIGQRDPEEKHVKSYKPITTISIIVMIHAVKATSVILRLQKTALELVKPEWILKLTK